MEALEGALRRALFALGGVLRARGQALERAGIRSQGLFGYTDTMSRHQRIVSLGKQVPKIGAEVFIAPSATVIGDVQLGAKSSVWYGAVVRGDVNAVSVGDESCVQDNAVVHVAKNGVVQRKELPTIIGRRCVVGHGAVVHAATVCDEARVGAGAVVLDGAKVESHAIIGSNALVTPGTVVGAMELWEGSPARFVRKLTADEVDEMVLRVVELYSQIAEGHAIENEKTWEDIEAQKLRAKLRANRTDEFSSHTGTIGMEDQLVELQAQNAEAEVRAQQLDRIAREKQQSSVAATH